jgi:hypothetical protein
MANKHGRYYTVDPKNPEAKGICDRSGFVFNHSDLVKQMEWRGDSLEWTGLMVGRPFLDKPNEQFRNPEVGPDSVPVENPKLPTITSVSWSNQMIPWSQLTVLSWASWGGVEQGILAAPENERLQALEENRSVSQEYSSGPYQNYETDLTQEQILNQLENYNWSSNKWPI